MAEEDQSRGIVALQDVQSKLLRAISQKDAHSCNVLLREIQSWSSQDWQLLFAERQRFDFNALRMIHAMVVHDLDPGGWQESDVALEFLEDYLDLIVVPMVLQRASLREESLQCHCEHCNSALQAIHRLQDRSALACLHQANVMSFLGRCLEEAANSTIDTPPDCMHERFNAAVAASASLAVLGAFSRLQDTYLYSVPLGVVRSLTDLLGRAVSLRLKYAQPLALSLHILRNVAENHQEVMDLSANSFRECFQRMLFEDDEGKQLFVQSADAMKDRSETGNPQESDGCMSAEGRTKEVDPPKEVMTFRCCERMALLSVSLQAVFQSRNALQSLVISEEEIRQRVVHLASKLREMLQQQSKQSRLSFQSIRLYLLICRSSHVRRQYAILEPSVLESERRAVAFLLSVSKCQHCVLLRAMAQDVHSWLLWQSQGCAKQHASHGSDELRKRRSHKKKPGSRQPDFQDIKATGECAGQGDVAEGATESCSPRVGLFSAGEAVWMAHSALVLFIAFCLLVYWNSLEHTPASQAAVARTGHVAGYLLYWR
mmetsp:Transcript_52816/g.98937  ORF Transcript_52816/g.98937 Transcript_52816/m.98937 type:complete len:544 (+) Transcript_52816:61-1692(+)